MALQYQIPQAARFIQAAASPIAVFNFLDGVFTGTGLYDFGSLANQARPLIDLQPKTVYFIDRVNVGATIPEADYLSSINIFPRARLKLQQGNQNVHAKPIPVVNLIDNQELNLFVFSDKGNDRLTVNFTGSLIQVPATVGIISISVFLTFNIYAIDNNDFQANFRNDSGRTSGEKYRNL